MRDLFDTRQIRDDPGDWDALAERVAANAARAGNGSGFEWFSHSRASWLAASLLLAVGVALLAGRSSASTSGADWAQALGPADEVGRALVSQDGPPAIGALVLAGQGRGVR